MCRMASGTPKNTGFSKHLAVLWFFSIVNFKAYWAGLLVKMPSVTQALPIVWTERKANSWNGKSSFTVGLQYERERLIYAQVSR